MKPDLTVLNLGAGVQSTALILMAAHGEFDRLPDIAIFADTGWEPKAVYEHLDWLEREVAGRIPIYRVSAGNIRDDVLASIRDASKRIGQPPFFVRNSDGVDGILRRKCTTEYKVNPILLKIRELMGAKPRQRVRGMVEQWFGISVDEAHRMRMPRETWINNRYPLIEKRMDRYSCLLWLERHGYHRPPKSACIGCPYRSDASWREMRMHQPDEWQEAVSFDRAIRRGLPGVTSEAYLHRSLVPLEQVDLRSTEEMGQLTLFDGMDAECEGMCGV